ncbi:hypothetical protein HY065_02190, partial [Candidatus Berkelbacteria bacterium]|nr:hypothetical protein [Candidatus Berkelbacteria bacterium]
MKYMHYVLAGTMLATSVAPSFAHAADVNANTNANVNATVSLPAAVTINTPAPSAEPTPASVDTVNSTSTLAATALKLIQQRVDALNALKARVVANTKLTADQQTTITTQIDTNVSGLTAIATSVNAGGLDAATLRAKIKSIYTDFRIFAVFIPKMQTEIALGLQLNFAAKLDTTFADVQAHIDASAKLGADVTVAQKALNDAKIKRADAVAKINTTMSAVAALTPADYPDKSRTVLADARAAVK